VLASIVTSEEGEAIARRVRSMSANETTRIGTVVAGYRIESLLGRGGMSVVYLAEHMRLGRKVALKVLANPLAHDESFRERFIRESQRAAELDHPNVIPIYDAGEIDGGDSAGLLYIAMRYVSGSDLRSMLKQQGRLSLGRTLFVLEQVAGALDAAHDRNLIHRDVKPANILIADPSEHVYLTDFGVAKQSTAPELTRTGVFVGTVDYAAPEQIEGLAVDGRTDVYALGCVLFECLAGRPPYDRQAEVAVMHAHLSSPPPKLTEARPDLPKELDRVIATAMAKSMADRFATAPELVDAARAAVLRRPPTSAHDVRTALDAMDPSHQAPVGDVVPGTAPSSPPPAVAPSEQELLQPASIGAPADSGGLPATGAQNAAPAQPDAIPTSRSTSSTRRWLLTAALVAVAAIASAAVAYVVASDDGDQAASATTGSIDQPAAPTPPPDAVPQLSQLVPAVLWRSCESGTPSGQALEVATCVQRADLSVGNAPDSFELSTYPNATALAQAYAAQKQAAGVTKEGGRCDGSLWAGSGPWLHSPDKPGGERFCYFDGNDAVLVWTHEKLGQPNHLDLLALAREGEADHAGLFNWWRFWVHRIGKTAD
jgi:serine/threonine-protein kinase